MPGDQMKIVKVGAEPSPPPPKAGATPKKQARKSMKTFPRGVLKKTRKTAPKIEGVKDPARSPPVRKSTLKILTDKGEEKRRKTIRKTVRELPDQKVRSMLRAAGLPVSDKTPPHIAKEILEGGMEAGMIVSK